MKLICWTRLSLLSALGLRSQGWMVEGSANRNRRYLPGILLFIAISWDSSLGYWINTLVKWNPGGESSFCPFLAVRLWINGLNHLKGLLDDEKKACIPLSLVYWMLIPFSLKKPKEITLKPDAEKQVPPSFQKKTTPYKAFCLKAFWEGQDYLWKNL